MKLWMINILFPINESYSKVKERVGFMSVKQKKMNGKQCLWEKARKKLIKKID